jgi:hypothetical protein
MKFRTKISCKKKITILNKINKNASFVPLNRGGGEFLFIYLRKNSSKKVVTLRVGMAGTNPASKAEGDEPAPPKVNHHSRQTTTGFERPTPRFKSERPNHWTVLAYLFKN